MNDFYALALERISAQQPKERGPVWMVGEQLKDMLKGQPSLSELIAQDLENPELSLAACEKKIKDYADKHKTGSFSCVIPSEAERIIREFFGLPSGGEASSASSVPTKAGELISLDEFF